jgi:hypothetical protein
MKTEKKYALGSNVSDGLLCVDGHDRTVSTDFQEGGRYEGLVKLFDSKEEAYEYIKGNDYWALEPVEFSEEL